MKTGSGCRIGAVAVSRVTVTTTMAGPAVDAHYQLVDPKSGSVLAVSRKTRDWPPGFKEALTAFMDALEAAVAQGLFESSGGDLSMSIAEHLKKVAEDKEKETEG